MIRTIRALGCLVFGLTFAGCMPDDTEIDPESLGLPSSEAGRSGSGVSTAGSGTAGTAGAGTAGRGTAGSIATAGRGAAGTGSAAAGSGAAGRGGAAGATAGTGAAAGRGGAGGMGGRGGAGASGAGAGGMGGRGGAGAGGMGGRGGAGGTGGAGGAGAGGTGGASGGGGTGGASGGGAPTFADVYALFEEHCNGCHGPGEGGLTTNNEAAAYMDLVDADSEACAGKKRVAPGDPNNSVLFLAINRTSADGCNPPDMPAGGAPKWAQADIDTVRAWIMAGAPE